MWFRTAQSRVVFTHLLTASLLTPTYAGGTSTPPAGCSTEVPPGLAVLAEMRHDNGGSPTHLVTAGFTSGAQDLVIHANRYLGGSMLITHICIYTTNPDGDAPGTQSMTMFIADGDDLTFGDVRPGPSVWEDSVTINVGWQLVEVNPPVPATTHTWIGAKFPTATATNPHMGVGIASDYLPDGVTPTPHQSFVGIINLIGGQDIWTDYEDVPNQAFQGHRAIIRGLELGPADCSTAAIVVNAAPGLETSEDGQLASFAVALAGPPPQNNVLVLLESDDPSEGAVNPSVLVFLAGQYTQPQIVTVQGQDDFLADGDVPYSITMFASSLDQCYHQVAGPAVQIVNLDDDVIVPLPCPEDLDLDGSIGFGDLLILLANWGPCAGCTADLDFDGTVGFSDLLILLAAWGACL